MDHPSEQCFHPALLPRRLSIMRTHGNLDKDQELNDAAWEASRGAVVGAAKVSQFEMHV